MIKQTTPNNWFTGREVVELSGRLPSELFDLMKEDLQAYSQDGVDKIINRDKLKPRPKYSLDEILEQLRLEEGDHNTQKVLRPGAFLRPPTKKRTEKEEQIEAKMRFEAQKKDTYDIPDGCVAISFTLSPNKKKREEQIEEVMDFQFKRTDIEKHPGLFPEEAVDKKPVEEDKAKPSKKPTEEPTSKENVFRQEGPSWTIIYEGKVLRGLRGKGFELIHYLVLNEGNPVHIDELRIESDKTLPNEEKSLREIDLDHSDDDRKVVKGGIDFRDKIYGDSMKELKEHYFNLKNEIRKAENNNDFAQKDKLEKEMEEFSKQVSQYLKPGGQSIKDIDDLKKTKNRICKRIERALDILKKHDNNTWRHFYNALRPINNYLQSYIPDRNIDWLTK